MLPHVGGHVGRDVAEGVEGSHGKLEQEPAQHGSKSPHRDTANCQHDNFDKSGKVLLIILFFCVSKDDSVCLCNLATEGSS